MNDIERLWIKLDESLKRTPLEAPRIKVFRGDFCEILVTILSPSFDGMDESERQEIVWKRIFADFEEDERSLIRFIFTQSPSEFAEVFGDETLAEFGAESPVH
jgi:hypothetical protein